MQFTETVPPPLSRQISPFPSFTMNKNHLHRTRPWPVEDANCMEQLLIHCADAIESNDATLAQQILWVLNNIAPSDGDSNQRLASGIFRALMARAGGSETCKMVTSMANSRTMTTCHKFSIIELATFVDLTPWYRFGFAAANAAILDAVEGYSIIHIVDLSLTHCMQIPTLIDAIATRLEGSPVLKLTIAHPTEDVPPMLDLSYDDLGAKLVSFASSRNVVLEFRVITATFSDGFASLIDELKAQNLAGEEALVINCHMMLHYIPEETVNLVSNAIPSLRTMFLEGIRSLSPKIVVLVDEDADFTSNNLVCRLRSAFNYFWIPYDAVDNFLPRGSKQRQWYEADICWKIENVIAHEGLQRVERLERKNKLVQRMRNANFRSVAFCEDAVFEVRSLLDEHAAGWGLKREEEDLVLTWKGHNVVFATVWVPT